MAQVTLPYTLTAGTAENVNNLNSNLNALVTSVNTIDVAQLTASATKPVTYATLGLDTLDVLTPIGSLVDYAGAGDPTPGSGSIKWLLADGRAISRTTYATLFTALSTTYGVGDGTTTFNLPDFRGRVSAGPDSMGTAQGAASRMADNNTRGAVGGISASTAVAAHTHTGTVSTAAAHDHTGFTTQAADHFHSLGNQIQSYTTASNGTIGGTSFRIASFVVSSADTGNAGTHNHAFTTATNGSHNHTVTNDSTGTATVDNRQPYQVANKIIRVA